MSEEFSYENIKEKVVNNVLERRRLVEHENYLVNGDMVKDYLSRQKYNKGYNDISYDEKIDIILNYQLKFYEDLFKESREELEKEELEKEELKKEELRKKPIERYIEDIIGEKIGRVRLDQEVERVKKLNKYIYDGAKILDAKNNFSKLQRLRRSAIDFVRSGNPMTPMWVFNPVKKYFAFKNHGKDFYDLNIEEQKSIALVSEITFYNQFLEQEGKLYLENKKKQDNENALREALTNPQNLLNPEIEFMRNKIFSMISLIPRKE